MAGSRLPDRFYSRGLDGPVVTAVNPVDGSEWAVWSYRNGSEFDIAVAGLEPDGIWSDPAFIGRHDGLDQVEPALLFDFTGTTYMAYAERPTGVVRLVVRLHGAEDWIGPVQISAPGERAGAPSLSLVANRLVIAYGSTSGTIIRDLPLMRSPIYSLRGIQEGPDAVDPLGMGIKKDVDRGADQPLDREMGLHVRELENPRKRGASFGSRPGGKKRN
jgi:hypothetical protein